MINVSNLIQISLVWIFVQDYNYMYIDTVKPHYLEFDVAKKKL